MRPPCRLLARGQCLHRSGRAGFANDVLRVAKRRTAELPNCRDWADGAARAAAARASHTQELLVPPPALGRDRCRNVVSRQHRHGEGVETRRPKPPSELVRIDSAGSYRSFLLVYGCACGQRWAGGRGAAEAASRRGCFFPVARWRALIGLVV